MEEREWNEEEIINNLEIKRVAKRKTILKSIIFVFIVNLFVILIGIGIGLGVKAGFLVTLQVLIKVLEFIIFPSLFLGLLFGIGIIYPEEVKEETKKRSIEYVEKYLSTERVEVIPIKDRFLLGVLDRLTVYANINKKNNKVVITVKFNSEDGYHEYESMAKEYFQGNYKVIKE